MVRLAVEIPRPKIFMTNTINSEVNIKIKLKERTDNWEYNLSIENTWSTSSGSLELKTLKISYIRLTLQSSGPISILCRCLFVSLLCLPVQTNSCLTVFPVLMSMHLYKAA